MYDEAKNVKKWVTNSKILHYITLIIQKYYRPKLSKTRRANCRYVCARRPTSQSIMPRIFHLFTSANATISVSMNCLLLKTAIKIEFFFVALNQLALKTISDKLLQIVSMLSIIIMCDFFL